MRTSRKWSAMKKLIWLHAQKGGSSYVKKIISGVLPLSVSDAVSKAIPELIRFGKCYQGGTPSSASPVPIQCNNGTLTKVHRSGLPSVFKLLDYVGGDGSQYVITNVYLASTDVIECEYKNSSTTGYGAIYGIYKNGESSALYGNQTYYGYDSANNKVDSDVRVDTNWHSSRHDFVNGTLTIDDTTVSFTPWEFENSTKNAVLSRYYNGSYGYDWKGYVRKFKVTRGNEVICDLLPCENNQGIAGLYDLVTNTFYPPTGGSLIAGNEVDDYELAVVGTPEVLSVGSQTATVENLLAVGSIKDEQDIIKGTVTRRVTACIYDGSQPVGSSFVSSTGGKDIGAVIVYPLAQPVTETVARQPLSLADGSNTVSTVASISDVEAEMQYFAWAAPPSDVVLNWQNVTLDSDGYYYADPVSWTPVVGNSYRAEFHANYNYIVPQGDDVIVTAVNQNGNLMLKSDGGDGDWNIYWESVAFPDHIVLSGRTFFGGEVVSLVLHSTPV